MAAISGRNGAVKVGLEAAVSLTEWSIDLKANTEEVTAFGANGWKASMFMMSDWSATASGYWDMGDATDTLQQDLQNNILCITAALPAQVTLLLYVDTTVGSLKYYSGPALITKMTVKTEANGLNSVEFNFEGNGQLQYLTA